MSKAIDESGVLVLNVRGRSTPYGVVLTGAGEKKIELSMDGGESYIESTLDFETSISIGLNVDGCLTHIKLTGAEGTKYDIY